LAHDKITVDEPLISTDVDSLIRTIAEKREVPLTELRQLCKIDKRTMDKWIAVLEDEGYISIKYGLGGTNVLWKGIDEFSHEEKVSGIEATSGQTQSNQSSVKETEIQTSTQPTNDEPPTSEQVSETVSAISQIADEVSQDDKPTPTESSMESEHNQITTAVAEATTTEEVNEEFTSETPLEEEPGPEELLSQYLAKKREGGSADIDDLKSSILTSLEENEKGKSKDKEESSSYHSISAGDDADDDSDGDDQRDDKLEPKTEVADVQDESEVDATSDEDGTRAASESDVQEITPTFSRETAAHVLKPEEKERIADVRELMATYLEEINREKAKIESLKKEREALYREKFATMEGKIQADMVVLTERVIDKETKIADLKERVLELPDKVDQLNRLQQQMEKLKKEGRDALQRTKTKADEFIVGVSESKSEIESKIATISSTMEARSDKLQELEKLSTSLDAKAEKVRSALESARAQVDDITTAMSALMVDLHQIEQTKNEILLQTHTIKQTVASHGAELESLEKELEGIARLEHWVQEYIRDYEQKIEDVEEYISKSDEELIELKEAAESLYVKKYLGELENMTDSYQSELADALSRDQTIEQKVSDSRSRIANLVRESQEMIKKLKSEIPMRSEKDFSALAARVKARTSKTKSLIEEKQQEREKLSDDSAKTRKTKPVAGTKYSASTAKKAAATSSKGKKKK
jgi:hypothetical protein